jgi:hypothetical protein
VTLNWKLGGSSLEELRQSLHKHARSVKINADAPEARPRALFERND